MRVSGVRSPEGPLFRPSTRPACGDATVEGREPPTSGQFNQSPVGGGVMKTIEHGKEHAISHGRRRFMVGAAGFTFGIAFGVPELLKLAPGEAAAATAKNVSINPWVMLSTDGTVTIMSPAAEMGQGSLTSLPVILADEMDAEWSKVKIVPAPPKGKLYGNPAFGGEQYTAGSATVRGYFNSLRQFGAQVRYVLMDNAARHWNVPISELATQPGVVVHEQSGRRITYGEIAAFARIPEKAPE